MKKLIVSTFLVAGFVGILSAQTTYTITTVGGSTNNTLGDGGSAAGATFIEPVGIAVDVNGNIYITDIGGVTGGNTAPSRVRKIDAATGNINTLTTAATASSAVFADPSGKFVYVTGDNSHSIWKVDTTTGATTRYAGTGSADMGGDGHPATTLRIRRPQCVWVDANGNVFFCDTLNNRIHRVDVTTGMMSLVAGRGQANTTVTVTGTAAQVPNGDGGPATAAVLANPSGLVGDASGNLYFSDFGSNRIRRVDAVTGIITTVAGLGTQGTTGDGGPALLAQLNNPAALAWDKNGNLLIADNGNSRIRMYNLTTLNLTTVAGGGNRATDDIQAATSQLNSPTGVAVDAAGNILIVDQGNSRIRRIDIATGLINTLTGASQGRGDGGPPQFATFNNPRGVAASADGTIYISDTNNQKVRRISNGVVGTWAGNGTSGFSIVPGASAGSFQNMQATSNTARLSNPGCVTLDGANNLFIADRVNGRIRRVDTNGNMTTVAGSTSLTVNSAGAVTAASVISGYNNDGVSALLDRVSLKAGAGVFSAGTASNLAGPGCVSADGIGELFIADTGNNVIRKVDTNGIITTVVGFVTSSTNAQTGITTNTGVASAQGDGGLAINAGLSGPQGVGVNPSGTLLCIADTGNHGIRLVNLVNLPKSDPTRTCVSTTGVACTGMAAYPTGLAAGSINLAAGIPPDNGSDALPANGWQSRVNTPAGCAVDDNGNIFIADTLNHRITTVNAAGSMSIIAGGGTNLVSDGKPATQALLTLPAAINLDSAGNVYFTDRLGLIKKLTPVPAK